MRIILINDFAQFSGGSDQAALGVAAGLGRRGHRVTVIAGHGTPWEGLAQAGVEVITTDQPTTLSNPNRGRAVVQGIWNRQAASLVREHAAGAEPRETVIHVHGFTKVLSASAVRAAVSSGLPTVATLHDYFAACPNGGFFNYQTNQICRLRPLSARCILTNSDARSYSHKLWRVGRTAVQWKFGWMPSGIGHFIVPSRFAADVLQQFLPQQAALHVLPNPIDVPRLPAIDAGEQRDFVFVGRMQRDKGPVVFAKAAREANVRAVFVGAGDQLEAVRAANPRGTFTGWLSPSRVRSVVRSARALVNSSLWYETQGLSALEAAAHGVPAVVPDTTALREVVHDGVTGLWFRGGSESDLAARLARLAEDDNLARGLGRAAYDRFWSGEWDMQTHLDRLEAIYAAALSGPGANARPDRG